MGPAQSTFVCHTDYGQDRWEQTILPEGLPVDEDEICQQRCG